MYSTNNNILQIDFKDKSLDDRVQLTFFKGPASNTTPDNSDPIDWDDLSQMLSEPEQGPKDGSYFVRTVCDGKRSDDNMDPLSGILIIDADSGPNGAPCPPPDYVTDVFSDLGYHFFLYTSYSNTPEKQKYRIIFNLDRKVNQAELKRLYNGTIDNLSENGVRIEKNSESVTWSQAWYRPRYETEEQRKNFFHGEGGFKKLPVDEFLDKVAEEEPAPKIELTQDQNQKLKKGTPPCIEFYCNDTQLETTDRRNFNLTKMSLVAYCISAGLDEEEAVSLCQTFINGYGFSNSLKTPEARLSNFKKCYRSMKQNGCAFSCATVKTLGAPGYAFDCNKCALIKPNTVNEVFEWLNNNKEEDILAGWVEKTKGMDEVSTARVIQAVSERTHIGKMPLKKSLKTQQKSWTLENRKKAEKKKGIELKAAGIQEITYLKTATGETVMQLAEALKQLDTVYRYGSTLVSIVDARPESVKMVKQIHDSGGALQVKKIINSLTIEILRHELEKVARCVEYDKNGEKTDILIPKHIIQGLLDSPSTNDKPLTGIVEHPYIDVDYNPATKQGYDPKTGLFISYSPDLVHNFNNAPSMAQAQAAYQYLRDEVLADFPFASELDIVGAISILLTALQRKMITGDSGCPGYEGDAPTQSTGKTAFMQIVSYSIYNCPIAVTSWSDSDEEMGKHLLGILREGHSCVLFDNLPQGTTLESNELAKAVTNPTYSKRLLGKNETVTVPSQVLWLFTGNNISITGDFNTRILQIRLDAKMADPDRRKFKRPDLGAWCLQNRPKIIQACMTIILAGKNASSDIAPTRFREWDKFVRMPLFEVTGIDIGDLFERNKAADPKIEGQQMLLEAWFEVFGNQSITTKEVLTKIGKDGSDRGTDITALADTLKDTFSGNLPTTRELGIKLGSFKGRILGEYRVEVTKGTSREQINRNCYQVIKIELDV